MKNKLLLWLTGFLLVFITTGGCSSGGEQDIPSPPTTEKEYVNIPNSSLQAAGQGEDIQISFTTNQTWTASSNQSWCTLSQTTGSKDSASFKITLAENTTQDERTAIITIKVGTTTKTITVTQPASNPDKLELVTTNFTVEAKGKEIQIPFNTNTAWEVASDQSWCKFSATNGEAGNQSITVTVEQNKEKSERKAILTFKAGKAKAQTVTIVQEAAGPDEISITEKDFQVETIGNTIQFTFTTNTVWMIASDQSWCTLSSSTGEEGTHELTATIDENKETNDRTAIITIKAGTAQATITITQERKYQLKVEYDNKLIDYSGGTISVKVQCNTQIEVSHNATWLHEVKASASRSLEEQTIQFKVDANEEEAERETEITFFNTEKNLKETIVIKQEAKPKDTSVKPSGNIGNMTWG